MGEQKRGNGFFKMNNTILLNDTWKEKVKQAINDLKITNSNIDPHILWELITGLIRNVTIKEN
jgi:hypothetical protein